MSWAKPHGHYASGVMLDRDAINETLARYSWELSFLNESNFDFGSASTPLLFSVSEDGNLADDFACQLHHAAVAVSPYATSGDAWRITDGTIWSVVEDMEIEINTRGGMFLVYASFQVSNYDASILGEGHYFAIALDRNPQVESMIGSGDEGNDPMTNAILRVPRGTSSPGNPVSTASPSGPGVRANQIGLSTQWAGYIQPGRVRISLMVRAADVPNVSVDYYLTCRELIVLETHGTP